MLKQACVADVLKGRITREDGHLAVVTRYYPRGLKRDLIDDFECMLAPGKDLLDEFHDKVRELGGDHHAGFLAMGYPKKFFLDERGWEELGRYADLSREGDVYLICHCGLEERCHRELLLLLAKKHLGAEVEKPRHKYPYFRALKKGPP